MDLRRRDLLRILAGLPLIIGLPDLALGDDEPAPRLSPRDAVARARALGRPTLLVALPVGDWEQTYGPLARLARHLDELLSSTDEATRYLVANLLVVVAADLDLRAATEGVLLPGAMARVGSTPAWLLDPVSSRAELLGGALDQDDPAAARVVERMRQAVLPEGREPLEARRERELAAAGAARAEVERDLAALGGAEHEAASTRLAPRAAGLAATLTLLATAPGAADEVKGRARDLVLSVASAAVPAGARWAAFSGGCGVEEPYREEPSYVACGMAAVPKDARRYLVILAGNS